MQQASVNAVYSLVKDVCNSNNRGYGSPSQFNIFATNAQQDVFQELLNQFDNELNKRKRGVAYSSGAYGGIETIQDNLRNLLRYRQSMVAVSANTFSLPSNYAYMLNVEVGGVAVTIVPAAKASHSLNSFLAAPQKSAPIGVVQSGQITLYPTTISSADDITISYYKYPQGIVPSTGAASSSNPTWAYTTVSNVAIYNSVNSIDFELPKSLEYRLAAKVLSYLGVNMREPELVQFAQAQEQMQMAQDNG